MKKIITFLVLAMFLAPSFVLADGGVIHFDPYSDRWDFADETNQQAFINYEKGTEKMILSVGVGDLNEGKTMWIFPVPADPNKVAVDVVTKLPSLRGEEISKKAQSNLDDAKSLLQATQIYTIPFVYLFQNTLSASSMPQSTGSFSNSLGGDSKSAMRPDVVVFEHLEKEGITSEIVTARTVQGFNEYFSKKDLKIDSNSIPVLQNYIGKEYSFVVSWMDGIGLKISDGEINKLISFGERGFCENGGSCDKNGLTKAKILINNLKEKYPFYSEMIERAYDSSLTDKYSLNEEALGYIKEYVKENPSILKLLDKNNNQKGVFVSFPTDKIFFPLMPTSVYGSKIVPAEIRIFGYVTPDVFSDIKGYTKTEYYYDQGIYMDKELESFYNSPSTGVKYTKIEINAPSKFFTDDLWVKNSAPLKTYYQLFLANQVLLVMLFLLVLCSVLTGVLVGWLHFKEWRNWEGTKKFGLIGLANCLTMLGMIAVLLPTKTIKDSEDATSIVRSIKEKGYYWKRRISLGVMIVDAPFLFISLLMLFFVLPQQFSYMFKYSNSILDSIFSPIPLITFIPIIIFLFAIFFAARKNKEDESLFDELKQKNYSSWTFQPKDRRKIGFIILYSIFFLIISWIVIKLFVLSVGGDFLNSGNSGVPF
jgi:hypothetical protein